jgi:hypothetical protein
VRTFCFELLELVVFSHEINIFFFAFAILRLGARSYSKAFERGRFAATHLQDNVAIEPGALEDAADDEDCCCDIAARTRHTQRLKHEWRPRIEDARIKIAIMKRKQMNANKDDNHTPQSIDALLRCFSLICNKCSFCLSSQMSYLILFLAVLIVRSFFLSSCACEDDDVAQISTTIDDVRMCRWPCLPG